MKRIRVGLIGAGMIVQCCAEEIQKHPAVKVTAAHDPHAGRLADLCRKHAIPVACKTAKELLARKDVDAVYIAVPNKFHAPLAIAALQAGKHVILDKPFALDLEQAQAVRDAAQKAGKVFMLGMNQRYCPDSQKIRSVVAQGLLGDIYHAKAFWLRREGIPRLGTWFGNKELSGGGCMLDIGVHMLDLCMFLMDNWEPVSVLGCTYTQFGNRGLGEGGWGASDREGLKFNVDDLATALIRFRNGASVSLDVSWAMHTDLVDRNDVQLFGTEGGAQVYPAKVFRREPLRQNYVVIDDVKADVALPHANRFHNFFNVILGTESPLTTVEQSLAVQRVLDGIYASARAGKAVTL